ncbi:MAG: isocitrate lyase/phosphoenolpyruvate mutase family protein [Magnetovibrio sp.]|nr:isocitrate lyase/phosphoenolpyruvate mutase family protein [Magnetovibrio sp.]
MTQRSKFEKFKALHDRTGTFVIPNPWNAGSARILTALGFEALATTSAGYALSVGRVDSTGAITRDEILTNAREIVEATELPVSADLEGGFGDTPDACAKTIKMALDIGLVGGSIEDATGNPDQPIYDIGLAVERITAACEVARERPFLMTARAENHLYGIDDLDDTIKRLKAFEDAGADVLYAPGLPNLDAIRAVCEALDKPVNVVMGLSGPRYSVEELQNAGVKRVSVGGALARSALGAFVRAAEEIQENGTFNFAEEAISGDRASGYMVGGSDS